MSRQQQLVMLESPAEKFVRNEIYYKSVPRPSYEENRALDLKLIERGQLEPIVVNPKMVILDGYSRFELLEARGKIIKYVIRKFENDEKELEYVVEVNVMRRHLTPFQKIETLYYLYIERKRELKAKDYTTQIRILKELKNGLKTSNELAEVLKCHKNHINKVIRELVEDYCVRRELKYIPHPKGHGFGGIKFYEHTILPKGEERLVKKKIREKGGAGIMIAKITGIDIHNVSKGATLLERASDDMLERLRKGVTGISTEYNKLIEYKQKHKPNLIRWSKYDKIQCPHCNQFSMKDDFKVVRKNKYLSVRQRATLFG